MKKNILYILILIVNISFSNTSSYNKNTLKARELIFDFKFNQAEKILNNDNSAQSFYLKSYIYFLKNILVGGEKNFKLYESNFDNIINKINELDKKDSLKNILKSEIFLQFSIVKLMNKDFISGSYNFIKSYNLFKESQQKFPNLIQNKKLSGLYKIIAGITPENGKKFLDLIGLEGNITDGYKELNKYYISQKNNKIFKIEAFTLNKLVFVFLKEDLKLNKFNYKISNENKLNSSILFTNILKNFKLGEHQELIINCKKINEKHIIEIPIINYFLGISFTIKNTNQSIKYLYKYIKITNTNHFIKASYWQLARISILSDKQETFNKLKQFTLNLGETFTEADKQAEQEAKTNIIPNKFLLKSRLYFDVKMYNEALLELKKIDKEKLLKQQQAEYYYRLGRINYEKEKYKEAKMNFAIVLKNYLSVEKYYIPYSALQMAYIYEKENNQEQAKEFFKLALKLNNSEYKNSIKHQAKSGLKN